MSRLKSYIDGKLKLEEIIHPSKIVNRELRNRDYTCRLSSNNYEIFCNPRFKNWNRQVESKITAYINGEKTAKDLVHPSKFTKLSEDAIKQKIKKNKILKKRRNYSQPKEKIQIDWIHLGEQSESKKTPSSNSVSPHFEANSESSESKPNIKLKNKNLLLSLDKRNTFIQNDILKNTLILNGNLNILCLNVNPKNQINVQNKTEKIYENIKEELDTLNTFSTDVLNEKKSISTTSNLQLLNKIPYMNNNTSETITTINKPENANINELIKIINELLSNFRKLRLQYEQLLSNCAELIIERKILLKHQEISGKTINLLSEENKELNEKNQFLSKHLEVTINYLNDLTKELKEKNRLLIEKLNEKQTLEKELRKQNHILMKQLQQKIDIIDNPKLSIDQFKINLNSKINCIEKCFDSIFTYIKKTEKEVLELRNNSGEQVDKHILLNTIRKLDEQNSNLMGKVKHIPEKIKNILIQVSCSVNTLEEQNVRLLRTLQNTEIENLLENSILKKIKT